MMSRKTNKYLVVLVIMLVIAGSAVYYVYQPRRSVDSVKGIEVTAAQLVKEYQANEAEANKKYLDKAIQVTGSVNDVSSNQDGKTTVMLASDDAMRGVFCTMKDKADNIAKGNAITIKGFCSGMLSDVRLREAVLVK